MSAWRWGGRENLTTQALPKPVLREWRYDGKDDHGRPQLRLVLNLHPGQWRANQSQARFPIILASPQSGKTSYGANWLDLEIRRTIARVPVTEFPRDFLAVTATYDLFKLKMLPELKTVFEGGQVTATNGQKFNTLPIGRYWAGDQVMELSENLIPGGKFWAQKSDDLMWGRIILRSANSVGGLESGTCWGAWMDEFGQRDFGLDAWEAIQRRVSLHQGRVLGTSTIYGLGWQKGELYDRAVAGDKDYEIITFTALDNPIYPKEEFERAERTLPRWKFDMMYRAQFSHPVGLIYDCFDQAQCVLAHFPIPDSWLWHVGHDFGGSNPAGVIFAQDPGTGIFYLVGEYLPGSKAIGEQVAELKALTKGKVVVGRRGGSHQEDSWRQDYSMHGWPIAEPGILDVAVGISRVYALIKAGRVKAFRDCRHWLDEVQGYSYKLGLDYQPTEEIENKARYHLLDATRYILGSHQPDIGTAGVVVKRKSWGRMAIAPLGG